MTVTKGVAVAILFLALGIAVKFGVQYLEDAHVGLEGPARELFIRAAVQYCKDRQGTFRSPALTVALCKCYSERLANTLSNNDVQAIGSHDPSISIPMQPKIDAGAKFCADRYHRTGHF